MFWNFRKIPQKKLVLESPFKQAASLQPATLLKKRLRQKWFYEDFEKTYFIQNTYFTEDFQATAFGGLLHS